MKIQNIYPSSIHVKYDYIKIDNTYIASIVISELANNIEMLEINKIIPRSMENRVSIYVKKLDLQKEIKTLSKIITETSSEIKSTNKNQSDLDIITKVNKEATELRRKIQIDNEELYSINICILLSDMALQNLKQKLKTVISVLYTNGILSKVTNFRQEEAYLSSLPIIKRTNLINQTGINVTTSQLAYLMPYVTDNIYDNRGILYGFIESSVCIYDIFSKDNINHNMCILGSSGAGKSYFVKTIILRNYCMNIRQIVFDIEGEYLSIAKNMDCIIYNDTNFNLLYIPENMVLKNPNSYLNKKIDDLFIIINKILKGKLDKYENEVKEKVRDTYEEYGITTKIDDMYDYSNIDKTYKKYSSFPNQKDLIKIMAKDRIIPDEYLKELKDNDLFKKYSISEAKEMDPLDNKLIVFDFKKLDVAYFDVYINCVEECYGEKLLIYIDEMWKVIKSSKDENIDVKISELFKTIRKNNAGIVVISQDINDILRFKEGAFGKSIFNNSYTKLFFKMQYMDLDLLNEIGVYSNEKIKKIRKLVRGQAFMNIGDNGFNIDIKASKFENLLIEGGENFEKNFNSN